MKIICDSRILSALPGVYRINLRHFLLGLIPAKAQLLEPHVLLLSAARHSCFLAARQRHGKQFLNLIPQLWNVFLFPPEKHVHSR